MPTLNRFLQSMALGTTLLLAGCGTPEDEAISDVDALVLDQQSDGFTADFTAASVPVSASATQDVDGGVSLAIQVDDQVIMADYSSDGEVLLGVDGVVLDEAMESALERFAIALKTKAPGDGTPENMVYRVASFMAVAPVDVPLEDQFVSSRADERSWTSLCPQYYRGDYYTGRFDYECNCSWGFCNSCNGSWGSIVGGNNGSNGCYAACGAGCGDGTDYTVDCADHDACLNAGKSQYQCSDEWASASDDYMAVSLGGAPNCTEYILHYSASATSSATTGYKTRDLYLYAGQTLDLGTCSTRGSSASGDTYLRLYKGSSQVSYNDDSCGLSSHLNYAVPTTGWYQIRAGCYGGGSCSGKAAYTIR